MVATVGQFIAAAREDKALTYKNPGAVEGTACLLGPTYTIDALSKRIAGRR
ncbi:hypothetical protein [Arthrobacter sp. AL12]|uniref:hypothetical protein n=1 Tax=Arthrobacter sp. AL12 TaxID=3042241 RepID=UPI00249C7899|nr:hypothetical protein [Arthrobacter sp. AL12]MDI3213264.1 hypothetical protein [Arthrobacter sp. AL12]